MGPSRRTSKAAVAIALIGSAGVGLTSLEAQEAAREVAFVEAVTGRVVAVVHGSPALLGPLDVITDRTRVDLLAGSELRICHYLTTRFLTVKGPARIAVSADGVSVEAGKAVYIARETCNLPQATSAQAGIVARGIPK
jgi:hypothetical protein